jgi:hypothetical protein
MKNHSEEPVMAKARWQSEADGQWNSGLQCSVRQVLYDFRTRTGRLDFPTGDCCDMSGAIALFKAVDPSVRVIETFAGGEPDTVYRLDGEWSALARGV